MGHIVDESHEIIRINAGKLDPVTDKYFVVRQGDAKVKRDTEKYCK